MTLLGSEGGPRTFFYFGWAGLGSVESKVLRCWAIWNYLSRFSSFRK